jgi:parvulin-like peptidyl-prolyl isomerase
MVASLVLVTGLQAGPNEPEAVVNGRTITRAEVDAAFARTTVARQPLTEEQKQVYRGHVLNVLIDGVLVKQFLDGRGVQADAEGVERHIADFEKVLGERGKTLSGFLEENNASIEQMKSEVSDLYQWFRHVDSESTDENIRRYFEENRSSFDGSQVRASHILAEFPPNASAEQKRQARARLEQVRSQLAAGTDFASLAKQHSDCQSKVQGGDVGYFPRKGKMTEAFAASAFLLPVGQVSDVVESEYGYHLIKVTDRKPGQAISLQTVAEDVRSMFAADLRAEVVREMRSRSEIRLPAARVAASETDRSKTRR